jgi:hypothetical protein
MLQDSLGIHDITPQVVKFVYTNSLIAGHTRWKLWFDTAQWAAWNDLLVGNGFRFSLKVRSEKDKAVSESDWLNLVVDLSAGDLVSTRFKGIIEGGGAELKMMEEEKRKAYVNTTASRIISQIAALYGLTPDVGSSSVVASWYQANQTDWDMLQEVLQAYVPSANNRGDSYLNIEGTTLKVAPINYALPSVRKYDLTQSDDRTPRVTFRYYGGQVSRKGVIVEGRGFDRSTGMPLKFTSTPMTAQSSALADKIPVSLTNKKKVLISSWGRLDLIQAQVMREQAKYSQRFFGIAIQALNDLTVKLRDMVEISMKDSAGSGAPTEGRYGVFETRLVYSPQRIYSTIIGYRQESYTGPQTAIGAPVSTSSGVDNYRSGAGVDQTTTLKSVPLGA